MKYYDLPLLSDYKRDTSAYLFTCFIGRKYGYNVLLFRDKGGYDTLCCGENTVILNQADLAVVSDEGNIVDALTVYFKTQQLYQNQYRYFYIDKDFVIHLKDFDLGEANRFIRYEKYQIKPNGHIVRYFDQENGSYHGLEEQGLVRKHTQQGRWLEKKENAYTRNIPGMTSKTWLEASYEEGIPIGKWRYYKIQNGSKGDLLFVEEYAVRGRLIRRNHERGVMEQGVNKSGETNTTTSSERVVLPGDFRGRFEATVYGEELSEGTAEWNYSITLDSTNRCVFEGDGIQVYFKDECRVEMQSDTLVGNYLRSLDEDDDSYHRELSPLFRIYKYSQHYYIESPLIDHGRKVRLQIKE